MHRVVASSASVGVGGTKEVIAEEGMVKRKEEVE